MRRFTKKILALALAAVMILGCFVLPAAAVDQVPTQTVTDPGTENNAALRFTESDPFHLSNTAGTTVKLECEYMYFDSTGCVSGNNGRKYARVTERAAASNGKELNWLEEGNTVTLYYDGAAAGTYAVALHYRTGRSSTDGSQGNPNTLSWRGDHVVSGSKGFIGDGDQNTEHDATFNITVTQEGAGSIVFPIDSHGGPVMDYMTFTLLGESSLSAPATVTAAPAVRNAPVQVNAKITWSEVEGAASYQVAITDGVQSAECVASQDDTARTAKLSNLIPGNTYTVSVRAVDSEGALSPAKTCTFTTKAATNAAATASAQDAEAPAPYGALPDDAQLKYHKEELSAFVHFGPNTFNNRSWGTGEENVSDFMPEPPLTQETVNAWVQAIKDAGFGRLILTGKHHDGFILWDSQYTDHDVMAEGACGVDVLEMVSTACTEIGLDMGFYMSPWDAHDPSYGYKDAEGNATDAEHDVLDYNTYYENQLREVLGNPKYGRNGKFVEVWMDGAKGTGAAAQAYDFDEWLSIIHELQPDARVFGPRADDGIRWTGNERGLAEDETSWQQMNVGGTGENTDTLAGIPSGKQNGYGVMNGHLWSVNECDVSIESEWFWHSNNSLRSMEDLMNMYFKSVGRSSVLLLNVPPTTDGAFAPTTAARLAQFGNAIKNTFQTDFALASNGATATTTQGTERTSATPGRFSAAKVIDGSDDTYWTMNDGATTGQITIELGQERTFDVVSIQEYIELGQRISGVKIEYRKNGTWQPFGDNGGVTTTVGARRLVRTYPVTGDAVRVSVTGALAVPLIRSIGVFKADPDAELPRVMPVGYEYVDDRDESLTYNGSWDVYNNADGLENTHKGTGTNGAYVSATLNTSKFYVMGIFASAHGDVKVYIDDVLVDTIHTNSSTRQTKQVLYESPALTPGEHAVKLECITTGSHTYFDFDGFYYLPAASQAVEFERSSYNLPMGDSISVAIRRVGPTTSAATFNVGDLPGTAVRGEDYNSFDQTVTIPAGESSTTITITATGSNDGGIGQFFTADIREPQGSLLLGNNRRATITITDPNGPQAPSGDTYTADDPFALSSVAGKTVRLEAEHMILDSSLAAENKYVRIQTDSAASGGKKIGWFEPNNKAVLHYTAPVAGAYTVKMHYQSGRAEGNLNTLNLTGSKIETYTGTVPGTGGNGNNYGDTTFTLTVNEAGQGTITFTADSHASPNIDYLEFTLQDTPNLPAPTVTIEEGYTTQIGAHVSWTAVEDATGYVVSISGNGATDANNLWGKSDATRTVKLVNLKPGCTYTVSVRASSAEGTSALAGIATVTTDKATNAAATAALADSEAPNPYGALPDDRQLSYHADEMAAFIHFGPNTFTGRSWGQGTEAEKTAFAPTNLTQEVVDGWVTQLQDAGFKRLIMVAKHHDGLCLWDSAYTDHDVMGSPFGQDLLEMVSIACTKYDMDMGFYFSPWDMHDSTYGQGTAYDDYYVNQLREVLGNPKYGNNGVFVETWMDGAHGSGVTQDYDFDRYFQVIHELQPQCLIYTDRADGGIRWSGNEIGKTGDPCWQTMNIGTETLEDVLTPGALRPHKTPKYPRMHGQEDGLIWSVCECDVSIESEWFWHAGNSLRSMDALMEMYFQSVGYGSPLLLNVPPTTTGAFADNTSARLAEFGNAIKNSFKTDFAQADGVTAATTQGQERSSATPGRFSAANLIDGDDTTYWTTPDGQTTGQVTIELGQARTFDIISIQEYIELGQRIKMGKVEYKDTDGVWHPFGESAATQLGNSAATPAALHDDPAGIFDTVGARRLIRSEPVIGTAIRVTITQSKDVPILRSVGVFKAAKAAEIPQETPTGIVYVNDTDSAITYTGTWTERSGSDYIDGVQKYSNVANSTASLTFTGPQVFVMGISDPANGTFDVQVDGGEWVRVAAPASGAPRKLKTVLWASPNLSNGEHTVTVKVISGWVDFDGFCYLPAGKTMVEFDQASYSVPAGGGVTVTIRRSGDLSQGARFKVNDLPGTAVQGQYYDPIQEEVVMKAGQTTASITVTTKPDVIASDFSMLVSEGSANVVFGFNREPTVNITAAAQGVTPAGDITLDKDMVFLTPGGQATVNAVLTPAGATQAMSVSSSDSAVATASLNSGVITVQGVAAGSATVTVTAGQVVKTVRVTVSPFVPVFAVDNGTAQCTYTLTSPAAGTVRVLLVSYDGSRMKDCVWKEHADLAANASATGTLTVPHAGTGARYKAFVLGAGYKPLIPAIDLE